MRFTLYRSALLLAVLAPVALPAQKQPEVADNRQDEVVNLDRKVSDSAESFKILRSGDKAEINRYATRVYTLKHANPFELLPYFKAAAAPEKGTISTAWNTLEGGTTRQWIQVNVPEFQLPYYDALVAAYDVDNFVSSGGDIRFSYRTKYRSAVEVADFIRTSAVSTDGSIRADATTNTVHIQDSPSDFRRVLAQVQFYDIPAPQINIEMSLIELTNIDQTSLGLDWDAWKSIASGSADFSAQSRHEEPAVGGELDSHFRQFDGLMSVDATVAARFLNYLVDTGKAKINARTNLTITNGKTATLFSGTQVPEFQYVYSKDQSSSLQAEAPAAPADPQAEGLTIRVTPVVAMRAARMDVELALRSPAAVNKTGGIIYSDQRVTSDLTLEQDQLYKLGGVRRKVDTLERKGFPLLRDIPVIKYLFSNETHVLRDTELFLFLKPTWTSPMVPEMDAMQVDTPLQAHAVENILRANDNLSMSPEDAELLQKYFDSKAVKK